MHQWIRYCSLQELNAKGEPASEEGEEQEEQGEVKKELRTLLRVLLGEYGIDR